MADASPSRGEASATIPMTRWMRHVQLAFLAFFFVRFLFPPIAWWEYLANGAGLAAFLYFYVQAGRALDGGPAWPIVGMAAVGALLSPINSGANVFLIFAAYYVGRSRPIREAWIGIGALLALVLALALSVNPRLGFWLTAVVVIIGIGGLAMRDRRDALTRRALAESRDEVQRLAGEAERERIARDLHDVLGHTLSLITLKSELAGKLVERDPATARKEIGEVERISREAMAEVRETMQGYRRIDLATEIDALEKALDASGVALSKDIQETAMSEAAQTAVALVLRESVTNVIRHARATVCRIGLGPTPEGLVVSVKDDGRGSGGREGNGLRGMRARVTELGGSLTVSNGDGTEIVVRLPAEA